ncbi:unnamed protein product [Albugo candida]|uniref:Uncharacterized protein n=1 Tax=Albugo candida TaxID=65357 RepID=A0A024GCF4_9STRA|nr:unnamed protein product [Albugo candida]|eukprot:CCI44007.1 unnamed protein product [Albugo candida]
MDPLTYDAVLALFDDDEEEFVLELDAGDRPGLSAIQNALSAIRQLAYGAPADSMDEYVRMAETTALESLKRFCVDVVDSLGDEYLRGPSTQDLSRLLQIGEERGSLECLALWIACTGAGRSAQKAGRGSSP